MRLLSIDWDYFFPRPGFEEDKDFLYDWGHREDIPFMTSSIWDIRAASFLRLGKPLPATSGAELQFWNRFKFSPDAVLYYADSHSQIYKPEVRVGITTVWNFDAHHDAYHKPSDIVKGKVVTADNWAVVLHLYHGVTIYTYLPEWAEWMLEDKPKTEVNVQIDPGVPFHRVFNRVFLCRSGAWTPTWIEDNFWKFLESCPITKRVSLDQMTRRTFSVQDAIGLNKQLKAFKDLEGSHTNG